MSFYLDIFNNREKAIFIWLLIFLFFAFSKKNVRIAFYNLLKALKKFLIIFTAMVLYVAFIVFLLHKIQVWDVFLIKDTVFWFFGTAFLLLFEINKATKEEYFFKKIIFDNLKLILIFEFIVNLYSFGFWVELMIFPLITLTGLIHLLAKNKEEYKIFKKLTEFILMIFGICLIVFTLINLVSDFRSFGSYDNFRAFLLPFLLTFTYFPFLYFFALFSAYEELFLRLDFFLKGDKKLSKFAKRKIFCLCFMNLRKLNSFSKENTIQFLSLNKEADVLEIIRKFRYY